MAAEGVEGLRRVVLDCPEPRKLAEFYVAVQYRPPKFPDPAASQQIHFSRSARATVLMSRWWPRSVRFPR